MDKNGPWKEKSVRRHNTQKHRLEKDPKKGFTYFEIWPSALLLTPDMEVKVFCTLAKYCQCPSWDIRSGLEGYKL